MAKRYNKGAVRFNEDYPKLSNKIFTTIRSMNSKIRSRGQVYDIETPNESFRAMCRKINVLPLYRIKDDELMLDTDTKTREDALKKLYGFYPYLEDKPNSTVVVYFFERVE